jgi:hypothetical protein
MLDPIRFLRRRERLRRAIDEETFVLQRRYGEEAYDQCLAKLGRDDLTTRYRRVLEGAARKLKS